MKKTAAIIAEYNPFHQGHAYQIAETKIRTGADTVVILLSGDFVQRGAPAIFDKYSRTKMALLGGADIVLELPAAYACASAEFFAGGAVKILNALGVIDFLSFGTEVGNTGPCLDAARFLLDEPEDYRIKLKEELRQGNTFPAARKKALYSCLADSSLFPSGFLDSPNNILGIEYCKALLSSDSSIQSFTVKRKGNGYHETDLSHTLSSASALRKALLSCRTSEDLDETLTKLRHTQPAPVFSCMEELVKKGCFLCEDDFSLLLQYRLLLSEPEDLWNFADLSPDLARRICRRKREYTSFSQFTSLLKTRELTYTRISRSLLHILLSLETSAPAAAPSYVRLLGFRKSAAPLLRSIQKESSIPLLTKAADYKKLLSPEKALCFEKDIFAADLYETVLRSKADQEGTSPVVSDLARSPVILS